MNIHTPFAQIHSNYHFATFAFCLIHIFFLNHLAGSYVGHDLSLKYFNMYLLRKLTCLTQPQ